MTLVDILEQNGTFQGPIYIMFGGFNEGDMYFETTAYS